MNALSAFIEKLNGYFRLMPAQRGKSFQVTETRCGSGQSYGQERIREPIVGLLNLIRCGFKYMRGYKKRGADDCRYSYHQAPQGPSHENKTMSTPLLLRALPFFGLVFEFCGFVVKTKKALILVCAVFLQHKDNNSF
ncbi:hypothetical protein SDC9_85231 [bioreactor metagenome]|uniref:Uncharacterized protein n=1 Tax=bioreactor metagenome TaxID=1076179 RepID=A0A644ZCI1_9ZZZZ